VNTSRTLAVTPTTAEDLWQRLAKVLPQLLRIHVQQRHKDHDVKGTALPELRGPFDVRPDCRQYECTERGTRAHLALVTEDHDGRASGTIAGAIISASAPPGLVIFQCNTYSDPSGELFVKCSDTVADQIAAIILSVEVS
jgi:hypothetical protein